MKTRADKHMPEMFLQRAGHFSALEMAEKLYGTLTNQKENEIVSQKYDAGIAVSSHPVFQCTCPLSRGTLKSKGGGQTFIHHNADKFMAVNQLSICGAVTEWCNSQSPPQAAERQMEGAGRGGASYQATNSR